MHLVCYKKEKKKTTYHALCVTNPKIKESKSKQFVLFAKNGLLDKEDNKSDPLMVTIKHLIIHTLEMNNQMENINKLWGKKKYRWWKQNIKTVEKNFEHRNYMHTNKKEKNIAMLWQNK